MRSRRRKIENYSDRRPPIREYSKTIEYSKTRRKWKKRRDGRLFRTNKCESDEKDRDKSRTNQKSRTVGQKFEKVGRSDSDTPPPTGITEKKLVLIILCLLFIRVFNCFCSDHHAVTMINQWRFALISSLPLSADFPVAWDKRVARADITSGVERSIVLGDIRFDNEWFVHSNHFLYSMYILTYGKAWVIEKRVILLRDQPVIGYCTDYGCRQSRLNRIKCDAFR